MIMQLSKIQGPSNQQNQQLNPDSSASKESADIVSLMASAHDVLSEAQSVVAQSESGSDHGSYLDLLEQDLQDSLTITEGNQPSKPNGEAFDRHTVVENWIPTVSPATIASPSDSSSVITRTQMKPTQSTCETPSFGSGDLGSQEGDDLDNDDDLEFEALQGFMDRGFSKCKDGDWSSARKFLKRAIEASKLLPPDKIHQRGIDLEEAQFMTAICAIQQNQLEEAEVESL
jgi:hypothetical protein